MVVLSGVLRNGKFKCKKNMLIKKSITQQTNFVFSSLFKREVGIKNANHLGGHPDPTNANRKLPQKGGTL